MARSKIGAQALEPIMPPDARDEAAKEVAVAASGAREPAPVFLTPEELSKRWRYVVATRTLRNWRTQKRGPPWKVIGPRVLYALADVERYERERDGQFLQRNPLPR